MQEAVNGLNEQFTTMRLQLGAQLVRATSTMADLESTLDDIQQRFAEEDATTDRLDRTLDELHGSHSTLRAHTNLLRADLDRMVDDLRSTVPPRVTEATLDDIAAQASGRADAFYERFEDKMRGSAEAVRSLLEPYVADLDARREIGGPVIDIGCGRGEWLEVLASKGFAAIGIDTNEEAVARCTSRGLRAIVTDAITYLREIESESVLAVTAFHLVEHLSPDGQLELVEAALGALKPGGLLIIETPNPTNLNVGAASFYKDPTHLRPVSPDYLAFLLDDLGFVGVETRFLHPRDGFRERTDERIELDDELMWALRGPQDYAVIGFRPGWPASRRP